MLSLIFLEGSSVLIKNTFKKKTPQKKHVKKRNKRKTQLANPFRAYSTDCLSVKPHSACSLCSTELPRSGAWNPDTKGSDVRAAVKRAPVQIR